MFFVYEMKTVYLLCLPHGMRCGLNKKCRVKNGIDFKSLSMDVVAIMLLFVGQDMVNRGGNNKIS